MEPDSRRDEPHSDETPTRGGVKTMGDYDPRGSTDEYGRPVDRPDGAAGEAAQEPAPEPAQAPAGGSARDAGGEQTVEGADGHPLPNSDDRTWGLFCHLGALIVSFFSGMGFVVPLVIWLLRKDESDFVDDQGKEALNFQISLVILYLAMGLLTAVTCGFGVFLAIPVVIVAWIYALVVGIIASIRSYDGERYRYPVCWRLIK
jgi:uncharacterized protein